MSETIKAEIGNFNLSLDPGSLDEESAARAREALRSALAALGDGAEGRDLDLTDAT